jgi:hypothetical protein
VALVHVLQPLLEQQVDRLAQAVQEMFGRRAGIFLVVLLFLAIGPVPVRRAQISLFVHLARARTGGNKAQARRRHHALLRARHRDVHAPFIHVELHAAQRRHRVHHQQRVVPGGADGLADRCDVVHHARGGVDLRHQHGLESVAPGRFAIGLQACLDLGRANGVAHVALQHLDLEAHAAGMLAPADGEPAALQYQDPVALGEYVAEGGFPGAVAVGDVDIGTALGVEHSRDVAHQAVSQRQQRAGIDVHSGPMHRPQHLVRHRRRPRNGQEFTPRTYAHSDCSSAPPWRGGKNSTNPMVTDLTKSD